MAVPKNNALLNRARELRRDMTPQERKVWYLFLKTYPVKFYKQRIIGPFIVDFYCYPAKLVIEIDGSQHYEEQGMAYDQERSLYLAKYGFKVLRYSNYDINVNFHAVCCEIDNVVKERMAQS